jgi:hypothetical protein
MKSLLWKEWRENLPWTVAPSVLIFGATALFGAPPLMDETALFIAGMIAAVFGAALGFLQIFFESSGDKRSLLLHRPLSRSQIFLGKALAGGGLYLLGVGVPFASAVALAALPGHTSQPFGWPMVLPWLADVLTGLVYYFAGMLTAQREARWYGSRCLGLATGVCCSILVWTVPEFWQALLAIALLGGLLAVAAWGSFAAGGAYAPQPRLARIALAVCFLLGLSALGFIGNFFAGVWLVSKTEYPSFLDHHGRVLRVAIEDFEIQSVTDLERKLPAALQGKRLGRYELKSIQTPVARSGLPRLCSYRNRNRYMVEYLNETKPGVEAWWYVPAEGRLVGYDKKTKQCIGSFGPDGFVRPDEPPRRRFQGELAHVSWMYMAIAEAYLTFPDAVYLVDFGSLTVRNLFVPPAGETVLWASRWEDEKERRALAFVGTDHSIHVVTEEGSPVLCVPREYDRQTYRVKQVGRLEGPERYWVWFTPEWYLGISTLETLADQVVIYDRTGHEIGPRQAVPPRTGGAHELNPPAILYEASPLNAASGAVSSLAQTAVLAGTTQSLEAGVRRDRGAEVPLLLRFLIVGTQFSVPGVRWDVRAHGGLVSGYWALLLLSAAACGLGCWLLARRASSSRIHCLGWSLCGFLFGPVGLLLMLALQECPAHVACHGCGKLRLVTRETCEHCGAAHAPPAADGTEIFEATAAELPLPA